MAVKRGTLVGGVALTLALSGSALAQTGAASAGKPPAATAAGKAPPAATAPSATPTADEILQRADAMRSPDGSYRMEVSVESTGDDTFRFQLDIGGKDTSLIKTLAPQREIGKNYLMLAEDMWAYIPNIRRSLRVTLNQKLTGQAANGDISRMRWHGDYDARLESETAAQWVLLLAAKKEGLTYEKIRVFIDKGTSRPEHGEYLTAQGKVLKRIKFIEFHEFAGALRPSLMVIENAQKAGEQSTLRILKMEPATFGSSYFTQNNLQ